MSKIWGSRRGSSIPPQNIYEESATPLIPVGTRLQLGDRVFRYSSAGAAINQGWLLASAPLGGAVTTAQKDLVVAAAVAGQDYFTVTTHTTAQPANRFADGWATVVSDTCTHGAGVAYRIKSHPAQAAAGPLKITLYDDLHKAVTANCKVSLTANLWARTVHTPANTAAGMPVGVSLIDVTSTYYFWCQTWGPAALLTGSTCTVDSSIIRGLTEGRSNIQTADGLTAQIAMSIEEGTNADVPLSYLMIAP